MASRYEQIAADLRKQIEDGTLPAPGGHRQLLCAGPSAYSGAARAHRRLPLGRHRALSRSRSSIRIAFPRRTL